MTFFQLSNSRKAAQSEGVQDQPILIDEPINDQLHLMNEVIATPQKGNPQAPKLEKEVSCLNPLYI